MLDRRGVECNDARRMERRASNGATRVEWSDTASNGATPLIESGAAEPHQKS